MRLPVLRGGDDARETRVGRGEGHVTELAASENKGDGSGDFHEKLAVRVAETTLPGSKGSSKCHGVSRPGFGNGRTVARSTPAFRISLCISSTTHASSDFLRPVSHYQQRQDPRRRLDGGPRHAPHPPGVIRTAARAVIIRDGALLTVVLRDKEGDFHVLPGGGQTHGETLAETVYRECLEEIGAPVVIGPLLYIREYVGANHDFAYRHAHFHQVEAVFRCTLKGEPGADGGTARDNRQVGLAWLPLAELPRFRFFPTVLKNLVKDGDIVSPYTYLGDIN